MAELNHAYGCGDPGVQCAACAEEPLPPAPPERGWRARVRRELETAKHLRWIHVSTLVVLETAGVFQGLGEISSAIGSRISRWGERRLRQHYEGKPSKAEAES